MSFFIVSRDDAEFCDRLLVLMQSGHSLQRALELLREPSQTRGIRERSRRIWHELVQGASFQAAVLSVIHVPYLDALGELHISVKPTVFLEQLSRFLIVYRSFFKTLLKVSVYPLFLLASCAGISVLMWCVFLPQVMALSGGGLVWMTGLYAFFDFLTGVEGAVLILSGVVVMVWGGQRVMQRLTRYLSVEQGIMLWVLGLCCSQGVSLNKALETFRYESKIGQRVLELKRCLMDGIDLNGYFVRSGLTDFNLTGSLGKGLIECGFGVFNRSESRLMALVSLLNPVLLIGIGCVVFMLVYVLFVPMLSSFDSI